MSELPPAGAKQAARGRALTFVLLVLVLLAGAAAGGYYWLQQQFFAPGPAKAALRIQIDPGTPVRGVLSQLG
jgi:uncharacterized protein HemX